MEITLEKIELVKDRTGVSYKEAKDALEAADGSVVDAIINIEESGLEEVYDIEVEVNHNFIAVYTYIKCFNSKMQAVLCNFISVRVAIVPVRENSL